MIPPKGSMARDAAELVVRQRQLSRALRHEAEQTLGRIRRDGGWDRRYKAVQPLPPWHDNWQRTCLEIVIGVPLLLVLILGIPFLLWLAGGTP